MPERGGRVRRVYQDAAQRLRAELLARAAGLHHATPEAPEAVLLEVPLGRLVEAAVGASARVMISRSTARQSDPFELCRTCSMSAYGGNP